MFSAVLLTLLPISTGLHWKTDKTRLREAFGVFGKLEQG